MQRFATRSDRDYSAEERGLKSRSRKLSTRSYEIMKDYQKILTALAFGMFLCINVAAQTSAFTYQGKLTTGGSAASVPHDFTFKLFSVPAGGKF